MLKLSKIVPSAAIAACLMLSPVLAQNTPTPATNETIATTCGVTVGQIVNTNVCNLAVSGKTISSPLAGNARDTEFVLLAAALFELLPDSTGDCSAVAIQDVLNGIATARSEISNQGFVTQINTLQTTYCSGENIETSALGGPASGVL